MNRRVEGHGRPDRAGERAWVSHRGITRRRGGAEGDRMQMLTRGKSETPLCSPCLCEKKNADGEKAPTERRPPKWWSGKMI